MVETAPPPLWGTWLAYSDGRAHYRLGEALLCGEPMAAPTGAPVRKLSRNGHSRILLPHCKACVALNERRWAKIGAKWNRASEGVA